MSRVRAKYYRSPRRWGCPVRLDGAYFLLFYKLITNFDKNEVISEGRPELLQFVMKLSAYIIKKC